jgi:lipopolysaccharide biosynthesis glycosyltransferase
MKQLWESGVINLKNVGDQDIIRAYYLDWEAKEILHLPPCLNVFYSEVSAGIIKKKDVQPVSVIHYIGSRKPWMISIIANIKRMSGNFLWKKSLTYMMRLYITFPMLFFQYYKRNAKY